MLIGQYSSKINSKRRLAIPGKFRKELGERFVITRWYEGCLVIVSMKTYKSLMKRLKTDEKITLAVRDTERFLLGSAYELFPDSQGRVVVPDPLAEYAKLAQTAIFLGLGDRVEVWGQETWKVREKYILENANKLVEDLARDD